MAIQNVEQIECEAQQIKDFLTDYKGFDMTMRTGVGKSIQYRVTIMQPILTGKTKWVLERLPAPRATQWIQGLSGHVEELVNLKDALDRRLNISLSNLPDNLWGWERFIKWLSQDENISDKQWEYIVKAFKTFRSIHCN